MSYKGLDFDYHRFHTCSTFKLGPWTTISQDVQTRFSVQFAVAKFLPKIKVNF